MLGKFETYIHNDPSITTITDFLEKKNGIASSFNDNKEDFLNYDGDTGISNLDSIYNKYTDSEKEENTKDVSIELLKVNTNLLIPKTLLNKEILSISGINQFLEQGDFKAFYGKALLQLLNDPLYRPKIRYKYNEQESFTSLFPHASVWIYVGSLNSILNVTPYIININTNITKQGGTFNLTLPPVVNLKDDDLYKFNDEFYSNNNLLGGITGENNEFFFHKVIQDNDIVFIKFEKLEIERNERLEDFVLSKSVLANQIYDMIGLVDVNSRSTSFSNNDVVISITGRDFAKLLIDDGSYFFPLLYIEGSEDTFVNIQDDRKFLQRTFVTGKYDSLFSYSLRSIRTTMQFIINQLSNLGVVDKDVDLFSSYGERRTKVYRIEGYSEKPDETAFLKAPTEKEIKLGEALHSGVWQIIKLLVDENVEDRRVADPSISQPDGSLINQFNKLCQEPFVEFFGDTYGDFYNFIVRQPPFTKSQILSFIDGVASDSNSVIDENEGLNIDTSLLEKRDVDNVITIDPSDIIMESLQWERDQIYGWYEIKPQGAFIGQANNMSLAYIPIVYFPEYVNKWGCRRLSTVTNYISYNALTGKDSEVNRDLFKEAIINDYKYIIDSNIYLPFTRKGSITINGDRRIKRGTWIRHGGTNEIYYVESVSNNFEISNSSIDRTTTIVVNRGMKEKYIRGDITYFDIADTDFIRDVLIEKLTTPGSTQVKPRINVKSNFGINKEVFDFFYNRQQF